MAVLYSRSDAASLRVRSASRRSRSQQQRRRLFVLGVGVPFPKGLSLFHFSLHTSCPRYLTRWPPRKRSRSFTRRRPSRRTGFQAMIHWYATHLRAHLLSLRLKSTPTRTANQPRAPTSRLRARPRQDAPPIPPHQVSQILLPAARTY